MDDPLIALGSLLAVVLLVLLNIRLGGWRRARIDSAESAVARYLQDFWSDEVAETAIDTTGRAALLSLRDPQALGLVTALGDKLVTRRLRAVDIRAVDPEGADTLTVRLEDFVLPEIRLTLDPDTAGRWRRRIGEMRCRRVP